MGYHRAGFNVVGVDINPQPNYPFEFWRADAIGFMQGAVDAGGWSGELGFDAIHASPPCQNYANVTRWRGDQDSHPDLIGPTRELLIETGLLWVMENVPEAPIRSDYLLCGTSLGLPIRRHRAFETNWSGSVDMLPCCHEPEDYAFDHGKKQTESVYRAAMDCDWMTVNESREAIPPRYTEYIGFHLRSHLLHKTAKRAA